MIKRRDATWTANSATYTERGRQSIQNADGKSRAEISTAVCHIPFELRAISLSVVSQLKGTVPVGLDE